MAPDKGKSELQLLNSVADTGALSAANLFNVKGWVAIGKSPRLFPLIFPWELEMLEADHM